MESDLMFALFKFIISSFISIKCARVNFGISLYIMVLIKRISGQNHLTCSCCVKVHFQLVVKSRENSGVYYSLQ